MDLKTAASKFSKSQKRLVFQITSRMAAVVLLVTLFANIIVYEVITNSTEKQFDNDIQARVDLVVESMKSSNYAVKSVEHFLDKNLLMVSKNIEKRLGNKMAKDISPEELVAIKRDFGIYDVSIITKEGNKILVTNSSDPNEIGQDTANWEYYHIAMQKLFKGVPVKVGVGYIEDNYWVGPVSKSEWDTKFFKYAYYKNPTKDYILNPYILDEEINQVKKFSDVTSYIDQLIQNYPSMKEIGVVNIVPYLKGDKNVVTVPEVDLPVLHGAMDISVPEDREMFKRILQGKGRQIVNFKHNGTTLKKIYVPYNENKQAIVLVIEDDSQEKLIKLIVTMFLLTIFIKFISIYIISTVLTNKRLKPLEEMETHLNKVANGDFTGRINIQDDNELRLLSTNINFMTQKMHEMFLEIKRSAEEKVEKTEQAYHAELQALIASLASNRHDVREHLSVGLYLLNNGKFDEAIDYFNKVYKNTISLFNVIQIPNAPLAAFINSKMYQANQKAIDLVTDIQPDEYDKIDATDLITIVSNLVNNAFDALEKDVNNTHKMISVSLHRTSNYYQLTVSNNGPKIPEDIINKIWDLNFSTKPKQIEHLSRGKGLAILKNIIETKYDGEIVVESTDDITQFRVLLVGNN